MKNKKNKVGRMFVLLLVMLVFTVGLNTLSARGSADTQQNTMLEVLETKGPNGNAPVSHEEVTLNAGQKRQAKKLKLKVAVLMHTSSDFSNSVIAGVTDTTKELGGEIVMVSDAEFDANKQKTDIETALVLNPDIIVTLILDGVSGAAALRPAIDSGVKIALLSNLPQDFVAGEDYASIVTDDLFGMGKAIAQLMNDELDGRGEVGLMFHDAQYYVTNQRDSAVKTVLERDYPGIQIVANPGIANPGDGETIASAMLTQNPNIGAIYAPWNTIAEGVLAAARSAGRKDLKVFTMDLGNTIALDMAKGGNMAGIVADLPYELGVTLTNVAVLNKLGAKTPPFVTVPAIKVTRDNLEEGWQESLRRDLPGTIKKALQE